SCRSAPLRAAAPAVPRADPPHPRGCAPRTAPGSTRRAAPAARSNGDSKVAQRLVEGGLLVGAVAPLPDHERARSQVLAGGEFARAHPRNDDAARRDASLENALLRRGDVVDRRRRSEHHTRAEHRLLLDEATFHHDAAATDEGAVLDDDGPGPGGLE